MGKLARGNISITGLYEWGKGWDSETSELWNNYWGSKLGNNKHIGVALQNDSFGKQFYLFGIGVSVYLHPMATSFVIETSNSAENESFEYDMKDFADYLNGLKRYMNDNGKKVTWEIDYSVLKADYKGMNNMSYIPDFNNKRFYLSSENN